MKSALQSTATGSGAQALQAQPGSASQRRAECTADLADRPGKPAEDSDAGSESPIIGGTAGAVRRHANVGISKADVPLIADRSDQSRPKESLSSQGIQEDIIGGHHCSGSKKRKSKAQWKGKADKQKRKKGPDGLGIKVQTKAPAAGECASTDEGLEQLRKAALEWANRADVP